MVLYVRLCMAPVMYLHGWASGPSSAKGVFLAGALAASVGRVRLPNLNRPSFERLTYTAALGAIDETAASSPHEPWDLIGSSMGGYLAARWAELNPDRVRRLVLLCPALDLLDRLPVVFDEPDLMARWEREGSFCPGYGPDGPASRIRWDFAADARRHPARPQLRHSALIIHGRADAVIPIRSSEQLAAQGSGHANRRVELVSLDDDHSLVASLDTIGGLAREWLLRPDD